MSNDAVKDLLVRRGEELFQSRPQLVAFTKEPDADALLNDIERHPHAFVLGCVMDRQIKAERAWLIPYLFSQKLGGFEFRVLHSLSLADVRQLMTKPELLHRFPERMSENFYHATRVIDEDYGGDASNIWRSKPPSAEVVYRFLQFRGAGPRSPPWRPISLPETSRFHCQTIIQWTSQQTSMFAAYFAVSV